MSVVGPGELSVEDQGVMTMVGPGNVSVVGLVVVSVIEAEVMLEGEREGTGSITMETERNPLQTTKTK